MALPPLSQLALHCRVGAPATEPDLQEKARAYAAVRRVNEYMAVADEIEKELDALRAAPKTADYQQRVDDLESERTANEAELRRASQKVEDLWKTSPWVRESLQRADYRPNPKDGVVIHNPREVVPPGAELASTRTVFPYSPHLLCLRDEQVWSQLAARDLFKWMHDNRNEGYLWKFRLVDAEQVEKYRAFRTGGPDIPAPPKVFPLPLPGDAPDRFNTMNRVGALQMRLFQIAEWLSNDLKVSVTMKNDRGKYTGLLGFELSLVEHYTGLGNYTFHQAINQDVVAQMLQDNTDDWFSLVMIYYMTSQAQDPDAADEVGYNSTLVNKDNLRYPDNYTPVSFCQMGNGNITIVDGSQFISMAPNFGLSRGAMVLRVVLSKPKSYAFPYKQAATRTHKGGKLKRQWPDQKWTPGEWWERITESVSRMTANEPALLPRGDFEKKEPYPKPTPEPPSWDNYQEQAQAPSEDAEDSGEEEKPPPKWLEFSMMDHGERMLRDLLKPPEE